jgi:transposase
MEHSKPSTRRRHDAELKARVLAECCEPGASVAQVALAHGLNANLVHKWRRLAKPGRRQAAAAPVRAEQFIALPLQPSTPVTAPDIRIELRRGATSVTIDWPTSAASDCAAWMRELLR